MISPELIRFAVGILGNLTALFLFLSPLPTFIRICKKGSVEQYSPFPYLIAFFNSMIWVVYGLPLVHPHSTLILTVNSAGCLIEFTYLLLFIIYSDKRKRLKVIIVTLTEIIITGIFTAVVLGFVHSIRVRLKIVGLLGAVTCTVMNASPLSVMKLVIVTKSVEYMPLSLSLATLANSVMWNIYGSRPFDAYLFAPTALGTLFGILQLILYALYYKSTQKQIAERKSNKDEMNLAQVVVVDGDQSKVNNVLDAKDKTICLVTTSNAQDGA